MLSLYWYCVVFEFGKALLEFSCFADSMMGPDSAVLLRFLLNIRSVRILDTIICLGHCFGSFPWLVTLCGHGTHPLVVIASGPADFVATIVVAQALCLTIFNISQIKMPAFQPWIIKLFLY